MNSSINIFNETYNATEACLTSWILLLLLVPKGCIAFLPLVDIPFLSWLKIEFYWIWKTTGQRGFRLALIQQTEEFCRKKYIWNPVIRTRVRRYGEAWGVGIGPSIILVNQIIEKGGKGFSTTNKELQLCCGMEQTLFGA